MFTLYINSAVDWIRCKNYYKANNTKSMLTRTWKYRNLSKGIKIKLITTLVLSIFLYDTEIWIIKTQE